MFTEHQSKYKKIRKVSILKKQFVVESFSDCTNNGSELFELISNIGHYAWYTVYLIMRL